MSHGHAALGVSTPQSTFYDTGRFGRLFPTLPPFAADTPFIRDALAELGSVKGLMNANDDLSDPITLITDPAKSEHNPNNPALTAGMTFLGQFLDHDMTFDPTSSLARQQDPESIRNFRIPALDLDSVYGGGPACAPHLYDHTVDHGQTTMFTEEIPGSGNVSIGGKVRFDLPRNAQNVALTGDPRNDENLVVSQIHLALLRFHNRVVDDVRRTWARATRPANCSPRPSASSAGTTSGSSSTNSWPRPSARRPSTTSSSNGLRYYSWRNDPYIPVEFSVGAYRFGHSQVRPSYRANFGTSATDAHQQFFALIFDPTLPTLTTPTTCAAGKRRRARFIDWQTFFDFGDGRVRPNKTIDTTLSTVAVPAHWASHRVSRYRWPPGTCCAT